jgi:hypothetical protein
LGGIKGSKVAAVEVYDYSFSQQPRGNQKKAISYERKCALRDGDVDEAGMEGDQRAKISPSVSEGQVDVSEIDFANIGEPSAVCGVEVINLEFLS